MERFNPGSVKSTMWACLLAETLELTTWIWVCPGKWSQIFRSWGCIPVTQNLKLCTLLVMLKRGVRKYHQLMPNQVVSWLQILWDRRIPNRTLLYISLTVQSISTLLCLNVNTYAQYPSIHLPVTNPRCSILNQTGRLVKLKLSHGPPQSAI